MEFDLAVVVPLLLPAAAASSLSLDIFIFSSLSFFGGFQRPLSVVVQQLVVILVLL